MLSLVAIYIAVVPFDCLMCLLVWSSGHYDGLVAQEDYNWCRGLGCSWSVLVLFSDAMD